VYISYDSNESMVGSGDNRRNITPTPDMTTVSVLDAVDAQSGRLLWRFQAPELPDFGVSPPLSLTLFRNGGRTPIPWGLCGMGCTV
jgi:hypothetical protein